MTASPPNPYRYVPVENDPAAPAEGIPPGNVGSRPTIVRFGVLAFAVSMSILLYLDRFALSIAQPVMKGELGLDDEQMGLAQGSFFFIYALAQVPAGWLAQRFGVRLMLGLYVFVWSLAFAGMGFATGLWSLVLFRGLLGLGQAGAYPCAGSFLKLWFPVESRGFANSSTTMGGRLGNLLSNVLTPYLMLFAGMVFGLTTGQWRPVFVTYAMLGILWSLGFWYWFRNSPTDHPSCNDEERQLISPAFPAPSAVVSVAGSVPRSTTVVMFRSRTVWFACFINIFVNVGWIFLVTFMVTFLKTRFPTLDLRTIGLIALVPGIGSICGGLSGGLATDLLVSRFGLKWGRRTTGIIATAGSSIAYLLCLQVDSLIAYVCLFAAAGFLIDFGLGSMWAVYQDIGGKKVATILGFTNMCGNLAAFFFSWGIGTLAKHDNWPSVFLISSGALLVTMTCWFFVNPEKKLEFE